MASRPGDMAVDALRIVSLEAAGVIRARSKIDFVMAGTAGCSGRIGHIENRLCCARGLAVAGGAAEPVSRP